MIVRKTVRNEEKAIARLPAMAHPFLLKDYVVGYHRYQRSFYEKMLTKLTIAFMAKRHDIPTFVIRVVKLYMCTICRILCTA